MTMPIPVRALATSHATVPRDVDDLAAEVGLSAEERSALRDGGLVAVPVASVGLAELVVGVVESLDVSDCASVVFTHSLEMADATAERLTDALTAAIPSLVHPPMLVTGRPCSIIHLGVQLAALRRRDRPDATVLVLGGDVAPTHADRFFFGSAMGDSAVGMLLGGPARVGHVIGVHSTWHIVASGGAASDPADIARFRAENPTAIRTTITGALRSAGLGWSDLTAIVPHTPYRRIWDAIAELCRFPREQILDQGIAETGHLNSNDVVHHLAAAIADARLRSGDLAALVSPGFGGTRGCTLVRVR